MPRDIDGLMAVTLKHLRERWWDSSFTAFLDETLQPRAGKRLLDVGCGVGTAELHLAQLRVPQLTLVGIDRDIHSVTHAHELLGDHQLDVHLAAGNAVALPFRAASFDGVFCVAVLQHLADPAAALREFARVVRPGGRVLVVEPDNSARYWFSSCESGTLAHRAAEAFFLAVESQGGSGPPSPLGPSMPQLMRGVGLAPLFVRLFPVSSSRLGAPAETLWQSRRRAVQQAIDRTSHQPTRRLGEECLEVLGRYEADALEAGSAFVEIQHTMLFATAAMLEP